MTASATDLVFPFGVQYYRAPTPLPSEWEGDLAQIAALRLNTVQLRVQWRWHERVRGEFVWSDLDRLFDLCEKHRLRVVFKFQLETAPGWVFRDLDGCQVDASGGRVEPLARGADYVGGVMPCFDRPAVREAAAGFVARAVERYGGREALLLWNVWNEPRRRGRAVCACPDSLAAYRAWLAGRFGPIEKFNARFGKAFGAYEDVAAPTGVRDYLEAFLFRLWTMEAVAVQVRWVADLVRRADPRHPVMSHVGICLPIQDVLEDTSDDLLNAQAVDIHGSSFPGWTGDFLGYSHIEGQAAFALDPHGDNFYVYLLIADWMRSVRPNFWVNEVYANTWWHDTPDLLPEDVALATWSAVAGGAKGLLYWQYRSERLGDESGDLGMVDVAGRSTARSEAVGRLAALVARNAQTFRDWEPHRAPVALLYDRESDLLSRIEHAAARFDASATVRYRYKEVLKGLYAMLWRANVACDFLDGRHLDRLGGYPVALAGALSVMDSARARALAEYVQAGGTLVVEPGFASRDLRTWVSPERPGSGLAALTAVEEHAVKLVEAGRRLVFEDLELPVAGVMARLETTEREPLARWGDQSPAVVEHPAGKGRVFTLGVHPALCFAQGEKGPWVEFLVRLLGRTGVRPAARTRSRVWVRRGRVGRQEAAWCLNYEAENAIVQLEGFTRRSRDLLGQAELQADLVGAYVQLSPRAAAFIVDDRQDV